MTATVTYQVGGLTFGEDAPVIDATGCAWVVQNEEGWSGSPDVRMVGADRPRAHGALDGQSYLSGRSILLTCRVTAPDDARLRAALRTLAAALADGAGLSRLVVTEPGTVHQAMVRRADAIEPRRGDPASATFTLALFAPDPRRYEATATQVATGLPTASTGIAFPVSFPLSWPAGSTTGQVVADNTGTADTFPTFTITGPCVAPRITVVSTGAVLALSTSLAAADVLVIDCAAGTVVLNGAASRRADLTAGSAPVASITLPPGPSTLLFRASSSPGGATLTTTWRGASW